MQNRKKAGARRHHSSMPGTIAGTCAWYKCVIHLTYLLVHNIFTFKYLMLLVDILINFLFVVHRNIKLSYCHQTVCSCAADTITVDAVH